MSAHSFASANISFGLISIPVKLYSTGEASAGIQLNMVHQGCGSRLRQQYFCPVHNEVVEKGGIAKGYEHSKGQYVLFTEEELKALQSKATNAIAINEFLPLEAIDPVYFEKAWYLGPDKGGDRPYRLLAEAMKVTNRAALGSYSARGRDQLVLLRPFEEGLIMQQLRYADELRPFSEVPLGAAEVNEPELKLAVQLIAQVTTEEFHPEDYEDSQQKRVRELIDRKIQGEAIVVAPKETAKGEIVDLMAALKAAVKASAKTVESEELPALVANRRPPKRSALTPKPATGKSKPKKRA